METQTTQTCKKIGGLLCSVDARPWPLGPVTNLFKKFNLLLMTFTSNKNINIEITEEELNKRLDQIESLDCDDDLRQFLKDALGAIGLGKK